MCTYTHTHTTHARTHTNTHTTHAYTHTHTHTNTHTQSTHTLTVNRQWQTVLNCKGIPGREVIMEFKNDSANSNRFF